MKTVHCKIGLSVVILCSVVPAFGKVISLGPSIAWLSVRGTDNSLDMQFPPTIWLPSSGTLQCLNQPNVTARSDYQFSESGFSVSTVRYTLGAADGVSSFAGLYSQIVFTPTVDVIYSINGSFSWTGKWCNGVTLWARLQDITDANPGTVITNHYYNKTGQSTVNLAVTPAEGRPNTGTLTAGRTYEFDFELAADNNPLSPEIGIASGLLGMTFAPLHAACGDTGHPYPVGDVNQDCHVSIDDLAALSSYWLADWCTGPDWCQRSDFTRDGLVNLQDLIKIVTNWLSCTDPLAPCNFAP
jgi:hypothetical protein